MPFSGLVDLMMGQKTEIICFMIMKTGNTCLKIVGSNFSFALLSSFESVFRKNVEVKVVEKIQKNSLDVFLIMESERYCWDIDLFFGLPKVLNSLGLRKVLFVRKI